MNALLVQAVNAAAVVVVVKSRPWFVEDGVASWGEHG